MTQEFEWLDEPLTFDDAAAFTPVPLAEIPVFDAAPQGIHGEGNGWTWHDTALIAVERVTPDGEDHEYAVSLVDLYAHAETGAIGGRTLEIGASADVDEMTGLIETLNDDMTEAQTLPFERAEFVQEWTTERALEQGTIPPVWSDASAGEIAAYEQLHGLGEIDITNDETREMPAVNAPDDWETFVEAHTVDPPEMERHYWQMHTVAVETPDGQPLGAALVVTEYPQLPPDFSGDLPDDVESRTLEMAHFPSVEAAEKFEQDFRSYLVPGLLDAPELAKEVAKLEGLSGEWIEMEGNSLVREADEWQVHDPQVERDAPSIDF